MKKIIMFILILLVFSPLELSANEERELIDYKEDSSVIRALAGYNSNLGNSEYLYARELTGWAMDELYDSGSIFWIQLYDLVYQEEFHYMTEEFDYSSAPPLGVYSYPTGHDMDMELRLRIDRLVEDGFILEEMTGGRLDKKKLATILYSIYGKELPFEGSVAYRDTDDEAIRWAGERGIPYYLNHSGFDIYPKQSLHDQYIYQFRYCLAYAYIYFPNPITGEYITFKTDNDINIQYINMIREEVKKPRLGYWDRDIHNSEILNHLVEEYQKNKTDSKLNEIYLNLKNEYNLMGYQDNKYYVKYKLSSSN